LPDNDVAFYSNDVSTLNYITLPADQFIIFLPDDIHQPEVLVDQPSTVKKVVMKVRYA
jgi:YhcH/YjgK/YiaL family protein